MRRGTVIKIVIVSALLVACIVGLTVYADGNHSTDKDSEVVQKVQKEKAIVEESTPTVTATVEEEFGPIRPVRVTQKEEVIKDEHDGRISKENESGTEGTGTDELTDKEQVADVIGEAVPGDDSQGNADNEQVAGEDRSGLEVAEIEEPVAEEPAPEEPVYEEQNYEEPAPEEPVYEEPVAYEEPVYEEPQEESNDDGWVYYGTCRITFYDWDYCCCGQWAWGPTASGANPTEGWTVANGSLSFGTIVMIDGHEYCVEDRGVGGDQFDVFVGSHDEAMARGMYYTDVWVKYPV